MEDILELALGMEVNGEGEGEEEGEETIRTLGSIEFLTQDTEQSGTTHVDARNGSNKMNRLSMLWTVHHLWPEMERFAFNCYRYWAQLLLCQPRGSPVTIII